MIVKFLLLSLFILGLSAQQSIDDLISEVFGDLATTPATPGTGGTPGSVDPTISHREPAVNTTGCPLGQECVPAYLCKDGLIITDGEAIFDIRFDGDTLPQCLNIETCCALKDKLTEPVIRPKQTPEGCGYRNVAGIGFKITGDKHQEAQYGEFPWMVAILKEEKAIGQILNIYKCGGSLFHPLVVLTAAHCVETEMPGALKVRAGEWDTQTKGELFPDQDRKVVEIVVHENYYRGGLFNDIALLFVDKPFDLIDNVRTICLPPPNTNFDYSRCYATGWGKNIFGQGGIYQVILKKIDLPIIPRDKCQEELRKTRLGNHFELHQSFICAGGEKGKDTCRGDGGSPLVCPIPGADERYYQAGIVAWGIGCGDPIPAVYASVSQLRGWIDEKLAYKKIDTSFFTP